MSGSAANTLWATSFADELARLGVREVALAPGSRSTPLVLAFARDGRFRLRVHLDERSTAFFALGVGRASGRPAVVLTTSGTAAANLLPAVIEASQSAVPLLILTADRPHRLRDSDASQAIDQVRIYGRFVRDFFDIAPPSISGPALRHLRMVAGRAVAAATGPTAGPVHLNFPFDKPLEPVDGSSDFAAAEPLAAAGRPDGAPFVRISTGRRCPSPDDLELLLAVLDSPRGVIVAGPASEPDRVGGAVLRLAGRTGFPVLADPLSGARYRAPDGAHRVAAYDLFLRDTDVADLLAPDVILRVGASPTSAALQGWMLHHSGVPHVVVDDARRWKDHGATATHYLHADAATTLAAAAERVTLFASDEWREAWLVAEAAALRVLAADSGQAHEGDVLAIVARATPPEATLFISSSMPVRDLDAFAHPREETMHVFGNRGASGIDGIVSTAFGVASQRGTPTVCVLGDIAFFHDQNGLLWSREDDAAVVFVLVDNDGGGIFHMLPIAEHEPHFSEYFATPHGLDLRHTADLHRVDFHEASVPELGDALTEALSQGRTVVLRVRTDRAANRARHLEVQEAVARSAREAITGRHDIESWEDTDRR